MVTGFKQSWGFQPINSCVHDLDGTDGIPNSCATDSKSERSFAYISPIFTGFKQLFLCSNFSFMRNVCENGRNVKIVPS